MHPNRGNIERVRQRARHARPHQQSAGEPRTLRKGDAIEVSQCAPTLGKHLTGQWQQTPDVVARRQFRHHAAIFVVHGDLRIQGVRQQALRAVIQRDTGFIAGRFNAKYQH